MTAVPSEFLSTPSARRATLLFIVQKPKGEISIHALREEGDGYYMRALGLYAISIHALREEGDEFLQPLESSHIDFYPRPPRGGRPTRVSRRYHAELFLSTPSVRRATIRAGEDFFDHGFLSTPSTRRATPDPRADFAHQAISIHALREEGDVFTLASAALL